jgi:hypothetical protein
VSGRSPPPWGRGRSPWGTGRRWRRGSEEWRREEAAAVRGGGTRRVGGFVVLGVFWAGV